ncbi:MAG: HAMP domain-containing protein [Bdellovibrionaceae bacterium]|nr:HAMP domain-containing protein [Bdellovibrio sp.]
MNEKKPPYQKQSSLRSILIAWFLIFSVVPLAFVAWYSVFKFEKAIDNELSERLRGNGREIEVMIADYYTHLIQSRDSLVKNPHLLYNLTTGDIKSIQDFSMEWIKTTVASSMSLYDRDGRLLSTVFKDDKANVRFFSPNAEKILLNEKYRSHLKGRTDLGLVDYLEANKVSLILFSKIVSSSGKVVGYVEQIIDLKDYFLSRIKSKLKLEAFLVRDSGQIIAATLPQFRYVSKTFVEKAMRESDGDRFFEIKTDTQPYGFILYPITWDRSHFYIALGVTKKDSQSVLKNVNIAFLTVMSIVILFLITTVLISTKWLLKPINELIAGLRSFDKTESLVQIPVKNKTEIGLLTSTFNEMSFKIFQARNDLKKKIKELEMANNDLKEAQTKLVHSAKMTSLGQLVAGVAHELNNPIGFIYSNTSHLKDYSEKLFQIIDAFDKSPTQANQVKEQVDYDFIKEDLPKLIKSCQDGAQRTRDIVLGLRNFSRLEEAQLKEIDLRDALETTLELLKGEIKNRIIVHRQFEPVPKVLCYASQINQVFMNILSNAVQAIQGNGQIWISTLPIRASADQPGRVQVSIQDSGEGMDATVLEKIFEPFFTTKGVGQGTGLGLSISYGIIQNHGGEIQVRSEKGVGTEFIVIIPVTQTKR